MVSRINYRLFHGKISLFCRRVRKCVKKRQKRNIQDVELGWTNDATYTTPWSDVPSSGGSQDGYEPIDFIDESNRPPPPPPRERTTLPSSFASLTDKGADEETPGHLPLPGNDDSHSPSDASNSYLCQAREKKSLERDGHDEDSISRETDDADSIYGDLPTDTDGICWGLPSDTLPSIPIKTYKKSSAATTEVLESDTSLGTFNGTDKVN